MGAAGKASPAERLPLLPQHGERRAAEKPIINLNRCSDRTKHLAAALATLTILGTIAYLVCSIPPCAELDYSVAITGTDGLNATDLLRPTTLLSPAFDLAFRIRKREQDDCGWHACIGGPDKKLAVSYSGVLLADRVAPLMPKICASRERPEAELNATAWSIGVALPRFLREKLAAELERGEAVFDVEYDPPSALACKTRIGQDLCPCTYEPSW